MSKRHSKTRSIIDQKPINNDLSSKDKHKTKSHHHDPVKQEDIERKEMFPNLYAYRKRLFKDRESLMHQIFSVHEAKQNSQKSIIGFHNLFVLILILSALTHAIMYSVQKGEWFNLKVFKTFDYDFFKMISMWPLFTLWSSTAFIIQKLFSKGLISKITMIILQHLTQAVPFAVVSSKILEDDLGYIQALFLIFQTCIHFMKMHSYNMTNLMLREESLYCKKKNIKSISNYPENINIYDFAYYMCAPVLVYWYEFPKREKIRWGLFFERAIFAFIGLLGIYLIVGETIIPVIELGKRINIIQAIGLLMIPFLLLAIISFFTVWDCILFCIAEITRFSDREFYEDWWNSTSYDEFNRKWNKIVHEFLFRHAFSDFHYYYKLNKKLAIALTILFSAMLHELLAALMFKKIRPFFLGLMISQIIIIPLLNKTMKNFNDKARNFLMWFGLSIGLPLIVTAYTWEHYKSIFDQKEKKITICLINVLNCDII